MQVANTSEKDKNNMTNQAFKMNSLNSEDLNFIDVGCIKNSQNKNNN